MLARILLLVVLLLTIAGCDVGRGDAPSVQSQLEAAVSSGAASFDFASASDFKWNRMYVFNCYSSRETVEGSLGFSWPDYESTDIEWSDTVVLVVFVENDEVVGWYEQPRDIELGYLANDDGYARTEAIFHIDRTSERVELKSSPPTTAPIRLETSAS